VSNVKNDSALIYAKQLLEFSEKKYQEKVADAYFKIGFAYFNLDSILLAEDALRTSIDIAKTQNDTKTLAHANKVLGNIFNIKAQYAESIRYYIKSHEYFLAQPSYGHAAMVNNQIAAQYEALGQFSKAMAYYNQNVKNLDSITNKDNILFSYNQLVQLYGKLHNYKQAYHYLLEGIEYANEKNKRSSLTELYITAGNLFLVNNINDDAAFAYFQEAKTFFTDNEDAYQNYYIDLCIADLSFRAGNDSLAARTFHYVISKLEDKNDERYLSEAYLKMGLLKRKRMQYDSALYFFQKSIDNICKVCSDIEAHQAMLEKGKTYLLVEELDNAKKTLLKSKAIAGHVDAQYKVLLSNEELAQYYLKVQNIDSARFYLFNVYSQAEKMGIQEKVKNAAKLLSNIHYIKHDYKKAADYLIVAGHASDSLISGSKSEEVPRLQVLLEMSKEEMNRNLEKRASAMEIRRQKFLRNYFIGGASFFVGLAVFLFFGYRRKRKDNRLLSQQKEEIETMAKQLHETDRSKLKFFTNLSHEIRTPLTLIRLPLEQMLSRLQGDDDEQNEALQLALKNTNRLQQIINQILDIRKLEHGRLSLKITEFDLVSFAKEIVNSFETISRQTGCKLVFCSNVSSIKVKLDQGKLYSMISNLLSNAFKFNKENGEVFFNIEARTGFFKITVSDKGQGIAEEHLKKIGTLYYQTDTINSLSEGFGIGLAYVKELVALFNGEFEIASDTGNGTTVQFTVPCPDMQIIDPKPAFLEIRPPVNVLQKVNEILQDDGVAAKPSILVIEDNTDLRTFISDLFKNDFTIYSASDGQTGQDMAIRYNPDLIISDIMMPGIQGNEMCYFLKNDIRTSHIPIILLTAKDTKESQIDGYQCGADDYIVKPFDSKLLYQKVKNIHATNENARKQFNFADIGSIKVKPTVDIDSQLLQKCHDLIIENIDNSMLSVEYLSEEIGLSRRTLLRKFKSLTGKSPADLIKHTRMTQAALLLREKKLLVYEVAMHVGYEDPERFSNAFKQFHGVSPSKYCN
jgi:signal transduction histidine kinase/DNA-binding response OmpR family regulator